MNSQRADGPPVCRSVCGISVRLLVAFAILAALPTPVRASESLGGFAITGPVRQALQRVRDDWQDWLRATQAGDPTSAESALRDLMTVTAQLGLESQPELAVAASAHALRAAEAGDDTAALAALDAAETLDRSSPERHFAGASVHRRAGRYLQTAGSLAQGYVATVRTPALRTFWLHSLLRWILIVLMVSGGCYVAVQMVAKGGDLFHDLWYIVTPPLPRGLGVVLVVLFLLAPLLLPSGLLWTVLLWAILLWGYGSGSERMVMFTLILVLGLAPTVLRWQQARVELELSPPVRAVQAIRDGALYGNLFGDLGVLRSLLHDHPAVHELQADLHRRLGQWELARTAYAEGSEEEPANAALLNNLGVYAFLKQDFGGAAVYFANAGEADPALAEARYNLSLAYRKTYNFGRAREALAESKSIDGDRVDGWLEADESGDTVFAVDGSFERLAEIRTALAQLWKGGPVPDREPMAILRGNLSLSLSLALVLLTALVHLVRRAAVGYAQLYEDDEDTTAHRLRRALLPGYPSILEGRGWRALMALVVVVALASLPWFRALTYRNALTLDAGQGLLVLVAALSLGVMFVLRLLRELSA